MDGGPVRRRHHAAHRLRLALRNTGGEGAEKVTHWRHLFWIFGSLGIVWCVFFGLWFRDRPEDKRGVNQAEIALIQGLHPKVHAVLAAHAAETPVAVDGIPKLKGGVPWAKLAADGNLWILCIIYFLGAYGWYFNITYLPEYLKEYHGVTYTEKWSKDFWHAQPDDRHAAAAWLGGLPGRRAAVRLSSSARPATANGAGVCSASSVRGCAASVS